jgi:hypothetical protein
VADRRIEEPERLALALTWIASAARDRDDPPLRSDPAPQQSAPVTDHDPHQTTDDLDGVQGGGSRRLRIGRLGDADRIGQGTFRPDGRHGSGDETGQLAKVAPGASAQRQDIYPAYDLADDLAPCRRRRDKAANDQGSTEEHFGPAGREAEWISRSAARISRAVHEHPHAKDRSWPVANRHRPAVEADDDVRVSCLGDALEPGRSMIRSGSFDRPKIFESIHW